jgi:hypothetical protein
VVAGTASGMPGTKQPVWQLAAVALQVIMQFVRVDDCASRIFVAANAPDAARLTAAAAKKIAKPRMPTSVVHVRMRTIMTRSTAAANR